MDHIALAGAVAREVKGAIKKSGRTPNSIANSTGIAPVTLRRRLTGNSPFLSTELIRIAAELGCNPSDFWRAAESAVAA